MGQGIEVYGPDGNLWVGPDDFLGKFKGTATYNPPANTGSTDVTVAAPSAGTLVNPFLVFLDLEPRISYDCTQQSGLGIQDMEGLCFTSGNVRQGYDEILVQRYWSYNAWSGFLMLYGER